MRRIVIAIGTTLTGLALLFSWPTSLNKLTLGSATTGTGTAAGTGAAAAAAGTTTGATAGAPAGTTAGAAPAAAAASGTFTGAAISTQYGNVQVRITVANGVVTASEAIDYPRSNGHDQQINSYAIPILNQEAAAASSAKIAMVSGATYTSDGYLQSLQSALDQAGI